MTQEKVHRLSSTGTKLLLQVIKAIVKRFREILEKETFERDSRERDSEKGTIVAELASSVPLESSSRETLDARGRDSRRERKTPEIQRKGQLLLSSLICLCFVSRMKL